MLPGTSESNGFGKKGSCLVDIAGADHGKASMIQKDLVSRAEEYGRSIFCQQLIPTRIFVVASAKKPDSLPGPALHGKPQLNTPAEQIGKALRLHICCNSLRLHREKIAGRAAVPVKPDGKMVILRIGQGPVWRLSFQRSA